MRIRDRIVGDAGSLQSALHLVSKQIRENPPKERPGGPPVTLSQLTREPTCHRLLKDVCLSTAFSYVRLLFHVCSCRLL